MANAEGYCVFEECAYVYLLMSDRKTTDRKMKSK